VHRSSGSPGSDHDLGVGTCPRCRSQEVQRLFLPVIPFAQATRKRALRIVNSFAAGRARTRRRGGRGDDPGDPGGGPLRPMHRDVFTRRGTAYQVHCMTCDHMFQTPAGTAKEVRVAQPQLRSSRGGLGGAFRVA
jgi:hypothetical protein